jgi:hypothetical protein
VQAEQQAEWTWQELVDEVGDQVVDLEVGENLILTTPVMRGRSSRMR